MCTSWWMWACSEQLRRFCWTENVRKSSRSCVKVACYLDTWDPSGNPAYTTSTATVLPRDRPYKDLHPGVSQYGAFLFFPLWVADYVVKYGKRSGSECEKARSLYQKDLRCPVNMLLYVLAYRQVWTWNVAGLLRSRHISMEPLLQSTWWSQMELFLRPERLLTEILCNPETLYGWRQFPCIKTGS